MNPAPLTALALDAHRDDLMRRALGARGRLAPVERARPVPEESVSIRLATGADAPALARLAALEGHDVPAGAALIAEVDGRALAALPLSGGTPLADPFAATADLARLLELRASQLRAGEARSRRGVGQLVRGLLAAPATERRPA